MLRLLINLERATDRLATMEKRLAALDLDWTHVPAFDCKEFEDGFVEGVHQQSADFAKDPGSIGSFMTHRRCWELLVESENTHAFIMEDDILFGESAETFLRDSSWIPEPYTKSVIHLETFGRVTIYDADPVASVGKYSLHVQRRLHHGSAAYVIHRDAAARALAASQDLNQAPDIFLFTPPPRNAVQNLPVLQIVPAPFVQEDILQRMTGRVAEHKSMIAATRKGHRKGLAKIQAKLAHSLGKRGIILAGKLMDNRRRTKTGTIGFE